MARKTLKITTDQIKALRKKVGVTQKKAAELVHISTRQWQKFEEIDTSPTHVRIQDATLELFCLKTGIEFPPNLNKHMTKSGKVISFAGGAGSIGRTLLTHDFAQLLVNEGHKVLIITNDFHYTETLKHRLKDHDESCPRIIDIDNFKNSYNFKIRKNFIRDFNDIKERFDFIFFDIPDGVPNHYNILEIGIKFDLLITPCRLNDRFNVSIQSIVQFNDTITKGNLSTKVALLLLGVDWYFYNDFYYHSIDAELLSAGVSKQVVEYVFNRRDEVLAEKKHEFEICLQRVSCLSDTGVYVFQSYSSRAYAYYEQSHLPKDARKELITSTSTIIPFEDNAIKREMLTLLNFA